MSVRNLSHIAIGVSDIDAAVNFYRDVVGLTVTFDDIENFKARPGRPAHTRHGVYLRWKDGGDEAFIVLDHHARQGSADAKPLFDYGYHHYGFWVDDVDAIHERALTNGANVLIPPVDTEALLYGEKTDQTIRTCMIRDPDGNIVQFDQRKK